MQQIQGTNENVIITNKFIKKFPEKRITVTLEESQGKIHSTGKYGREGVGHA